MSSLPEAVADAMPPDNELAIGIVTAVNPLTVTVRGAAQNPGTLGSYTPGTGDPVVLLRQDATWLCLGSSVSGAGAANTTAKINLPATAQTQAGAGYVNMTGAVISGFTKRLASTRLRIDVSTSMYLAVAANTTVGIGVDITDATGLNTRVDEFSMTINPLAVHTMLSWGDLFSGLAAGTYNLQLIWRRDAGGGTLTRDVNDWLSIIVAEVA